MGSIKLDIQWSPVHQNKFITLGTEINLYEVVPLEDSYEQSCKSILLFNAYNSISIQ